MDAETKALTTRAEQGFAGAQNNLGVRYDFGRGVPPNMATAYAWYNVAAAKGSKGASKNRDSIARFMTPEQVAEAQKLSKVWFELYQPKE